MFGMMPRDEVKKTKRFTDQFGMHITIEAGPHGWSILWADLSTTYEDIDASTEENFKSAYDYTVDRVGELEEEKASRKICVMKVG